MKIDPRITFYVGLITCVSMILGNVAIWTGAVPDEAAHAAASWMNIIGTVGTGVMTYLTGYSSSAVGPLVK